MSLQPILDKIRQFNSQLIANNNSVALTDKDLSVIEELTKKIQQKSRYHTLNYENFEYELLDKIILSWPKDNLFPFLDLIRLMVLHPNGARRYTESNNLNTVLSNSFEGSDANVLLLYRTVCNCFMLESLRPRMLNLQEFVFEKIAEKFSSLGANHKNAMATAILNYSITYITEKNEDGINQCLSVINEVLGVDHNDEINFRLLVSLGNIVSSNNDAQTMANDLGLFEKLDQFPPSSAEKVLNISKELIEKYKK